MTKIIAIGKGTAWQSFIKEFSKRDITDGDLTDKAYYADLECSLAINDGFIPSSLDDF